MITRDVVAQILIRYLNGEITASKLVDWAEDGLNQGEVDLRV